MLNPTDAPGRTTVTLADLDDPVGVARRLYRQLRARAGARARRHAR